FVNALLCFLLFYARFIALQPSGSPYHTILPVDPSSNQGWILAQQLKHLRSNSWSDSLDDIRLGGPSSSAVVGFGGDIGNKCLLGDSNRYLYDNFKRSYAEMLYRWGLLVQRAKVLKYLSNYVDTPRCVEFVTECLNCCRVGAPACASCKKPVLYCSLCRLPVRGAANACLHCGHGGHTEHMRIWFERHDFSLDELTTKWAHWIVVTQGSRTRFAGT
uniref:WDR59/RTC1-like RING zinc finger domain-containing protein n=1 Tax=Anopheles maculatus TaxID=74869 RepID=A0A182SMP7_9DIPT